MPIDQWSDEIVVAELQDDPAMSDDVNALIDQIQSSPSVDVVLNFSNVNYLNSSAIAKLLKLRQLMQNARRRLILCGTSRNVWGVFLATGLDKLFAVEEDISMALASVQIANGKST